MECGALRAALFALGLAFSIVAPARARDLPAERPLCFVRVVGPKAQGGLLRGDPDLPPLDPRREGRAGRRATEWAARAAMHGPLPGWWHRVPLAQVFFPCPSPSPAEIEAEMDRVRGFFEDHGWLEVHATATLDQRRPPRGRRPDARPDRLRFIVEAGPRARLAEVQVVFEDALEPELRQQVRAALPRPGPWSGEALRDSSAETLRLLRDAGYPWASVLHLQDRLQPDGEDRALRVEIDAGPSARLGELRFVGLDRLDADAIRRALEPRWQVGAPFQGAALDRLREGLGDLPAFAVVRVEPTPTEDLSVVPVQVTVEAAAPIRVRPVLRVSSDPSSFFSAGLGVDADWRHIGGKLLRGQLGLIVGYRAFPVFTDRQLSVPNQGPWANARAELEAALRPVDGLGVFIAQEGVLDTQRGYNEVGGALTTGLRLRPAPGLRLSLGPSLSYWRDFAWDRQQAAFDPWFGGPGSETPMGGFARPQFRPEAWLVGPIAELDYQLGDINPDGDPGLHLRVEGAPVGWADGDRYRRLQGSFSAHSPLSSRWWAKGRAAAGALRWEGGEAVPGVLHLRYFLGGWDTVRGWGYRALSSPGWDGSTDDLRIGGDLMGMAGLDLGYRLAPGWDLRGLYDAGRTWESLRDSQSAQASAPLRGVHLRDLQHVVGGGLRAPSPLGPLTFALAWRLQPDNQMPNIDPTRLFVHLIIE